MNNPFETIDKRLSNIENLLLEIKHSEGIKPTKPDTDQWFNIEELCDFLPDKPKRSTVYGWTHRFLIPFHKRERAKRLQFLKSEIEVWLKSGRKKTRIEIMNEAENYLGKRKKRG